MELQENACNVTVTLPNKGILDRRKYGEALGKGKGLCTGIPDYLPLFKCCTLETSTQPRHPTKGRST